jgi:predicted glycosyltransferase
MSGRLLFHCQHSLGLGHLVRSLALARSLVERFEVVLLAGGELPDHVDVPENVEVVRLPALALDGRRLVSRDDRFGVGAALGERAAVVRQAFRRLQPDVVVVELFPFGRKKLAGELVPMLREAAASGALVASSLRDILVRGRADQARHDERAAGLANELFGAVLVHADPRLVRLAETFRPRTRLHVPVHYTGFVVPPAEPPAPGARSGPLVVSAGGGRFGAPLLRAAAVAQPAIRARTGLPIRLVAGPFLRDADWLHLSREVRGRDGLELLRSVPDLGAELASARASLSQCGYNTALEVIRSRVPALVAPFAAPGEDEQTRRASLLQRLGTVRVLSGDDLSPVALAEAVDRALREPPRRVELDLGGAQRTTEILDRLVAMRARGAA